MKSTTHTSYKKERRTAVGFPVAVLLAFLSVVCSFGVVYTYADDAAEAVVISDELAAILVEDAGAEDIAELISDTWEGDYEEEPEDDDIYQLNRLMVLADGDVMTESYGATTVLYYEEYDEYVLQFDSNVATAEAYLALVEDFGEGACYIDEIVTAEVLADIDGIESYDALTWGAATTGMDYLKGEYAYYEIDTTVTVAIIDSGVDTANSIFDGRIDEEHSLYFYAENNRAVTSNDWTDEYGHGTHVAGIVAECTPENVSIMVLRCFDANASSTVLAIRTAMQYALENNADVLNMSFGWADDEDEPYDFLDDVIAMAERRGTIICCSAGNGGADVADTYPANQTNLITVASISKTLKRASTSNYGATVNFAAPGASVVSAWLEGATKTQSGTSMASPHMAAAAAYVKMLYKSATLSEVMEVLEQYAIDLGDEGWDEYYGYGYVYLHDLFDDYYAALEEDETEPGEPEDDTSTEEPTTTEATTTEATTAEATTAEATTTEASTTEATITEATTEKSTTKTTVKKVETTTAVAATTETATTEATTAKSATTEAATTISTTTEATTTAKTTTEVSTTETTTVKTTTEAVTTETTTATSSASSKTSSSTASTATATNKTKAKLETPTVTIKYTGSKIELSWNKVDGATRYIIYRKIGSGELATIKTTKKLSYSATSFSKNKKYTYYVRAVSGSAISNKSSKVYCFTTNAVTITSAKLTNGTLTVKWKKNSSASGYQVQYSTKSSMAGKTTVNVKKTKKSYKIKNLTSKKYYVRVRAYKTINGKRYYSAWKKIKVVSS